MQSIDTTFRNRLEEAVLEYQRLTCPNVDCDDIIISKEKIIADKDSLIEYWCRNPECQYHQKVQFQKSKFRGRSNSDSLQFEFIEVDQASEVPLATTLLGHHKVQMLSFVIGVIVFWLIFTSYS